MKNLEGFFGYLKRILVSQKIIFSGLLATLLTSCFLVETKSTTTALAPMRLSSPTVIAPSTFPPAPTYTTFALQGPESFGWGNGGWFSSLEIDKSNPNILYAASDVGGFFRSDDAGNHWIDLSRNFPGTAVWNLTLSPDGNTIYAQTKAAFLKSTDRGTTWTSLTVYHENEITPGKPMVTRFYGSELDNGRRTRTVVIDPVYQSIIYIAGERGKDDQSLISPLNYLYRTTDGGLTWQELSAISNGTRALVLDSGNHSVLYAAGPDGVRKSIDGGSTWVAKNSGIANLDTLDMITDHRNGTIYLLTKSGFYKSTDGAETWVLCNGTGNKTITNPNRGDGMILIDETNSDHLFVSLTSSIYETKDAALHWNNIFSNTMKTSPDPDYAYVWNCALLHCGGPTTDLAFSHTENLLYGAGDTGIAMRDLNNPNSKWIIKHRGLFVAATLTLGFISEDEIFAGGADTALMKTVNGGQTWRQIMLNDSYTSGRNFWVWSLDIKKTPPRKVYICNEMSARSSSAEAALYQSSNDGKTWKDITSRLLDSLGSAKCSQVLVDKNNENNVYVLLDNKGLYRSTDNAHSFARITDSIPSVAQMVFTSASFAIDPDNPSIYYLAPRRIGSVAFTKVYKSTDNGISWKEIHQYRDNNVGGIAILQDGYNSLYLSFQHQLQRSRDQGATWQTVIDLGQMIPYVWSWHYYFSIPVFNPLNNITYVQITPWNSDPHNMPPAGIYVSDDFGDTWERKYPLVHPGGNQLYLIEGNDYLYVPSQSGLWKYKMDHPVQTPAALATFTPAP